MSLNSFETMPLNKSDKIRLGTVIGSGISILVLIVWLLMHIPPAAVCVESHPTPTTTDSYEYRCSYGYGFDPYTGKYGYGYHCSDVYVGPTSTIAVICDAYATPENKQ
jgi:hypothetical protein